MSVFSASDAAIEGFQVLRRHWRVVVGWCLFSVMAFVGLVVITFMAIAIATLAATSHDEASSIGGAVGAIILGLGGLAIQWVVIAALYRVMLRPDEPPGMHYLRISRDERRLFILWIVVLATVIGLTTAARFLLQFVAKSSMAGAGLGTLVFVGLFAWLALRFSLAGPANFASGRFGLTQSWRLTGGRFWGLFGMALLAGCLLGLIAIVVFVVTTMLQAAVSGFHTFAPVRLSDPQTFVERPGAYLLGLAAELALSPVFLVIAHAPFVAAYRALSAPQARGE